MSKGRVEQHYLVFTATYRHESTTSTAWAEDLQEAYTAKTTTLYAEASSTARVIASTDYANKYEVT